MISIEEAKRRLDYDPATGVFVWKDANRKPYLNGSVAATRGAHGYLYVKLAGRNVLLSRLAWVWANGPIPEGLEIDHINRDKTDNRIANLRLATRSQNLLNTEIKPNKAGVRGVSLHRQSGLYRVRVGRSVTKYFKTAEEAAVGYTRLVEERLP